VTGVPVTVLLRGTPVMADGQLVGRFIKRSPFQIL